MLDPSIEDMLNKRMKRVDRVILLSLGAMLILVIILGSLILVQNQSTAQKSLDIASDNHKRSQEYIKCVAEFQLKPPEERTKETLNNCTKHADNRTKEAD